MKLLELQELLGKELKKAIENESLSAIDIDKGNMVSRLAKNLISNGALILRATKYNDKYHIVD